MFAIGNNGHDKQLFFLNDFVFDTNRNSNEWHNLDELVVDSTVYDLPVYIFTHEAWNEQHYVEYYKILKPDFTQLIGTFQVNDPHKLEIPMNDYLSI